MIQPVGTSSELLASHLFLCHTELTSSELPEPGLDDCTQQLQESKKIVSDRQDEVTESSGGWWFREDLKDIWGQKKSP